ncbi:MAG: type III pantothenate kinase [Coriobacteriia bacterium]|nr:type III pantothenate kinase [Coriobacteriia bacterium]
MLLAIDIGNTQTALGVYDAASPEHAERATPAPIATWRISTHATATPDELATWLESLFAARGLALAGVEAVCLGSVVPELTRAWIAACATTATRLPVPLLPAHIAPRDLGLTPAQAQAVGADRLANVVAARAAWGAPAVVVDFGTATNLDVIDAAGHFIGGPISAGLELSAAALFANAARLTAIELAAPSHVIAQTTADALRAGLVIGEAAKVDGLVTRIAEELGDGDPRGDGSSPPQSCGKEEPSPLGSPLALPVIATGGLATLVAPHCRTITACAATLTLDGLYLMAQAALWGQDAQV